MNSSRVLIHAGAIADGGGMRARPGALLLRNHLVIACGSPQEVGPVTDGTLIHLPHAVVFPPLVNVHTHLDLSHIGPLQPPESFAEWVNEVRLRRARSLQAIRESVLKGVILARVGGTAIVGDISGAGSLEPVNALRDSGMPGVSFLEVFGIGRTQDAAIRTMKWAVESCPLRGNVALGLQPHAPYSCGIDVYKAAVHLSKVHNVPLATHLAETPEELQFVSDASGPLAEMLKRIGVWDETICGCGLHPIDRFADVLQSAPFVAAHLNYVHEQHLAMLAQWPISVAYCPRASAYFGHPRGDNLPHCYRQMLGAGVNVALGTDSILCLNTSDRLSVLDEMRFLFARDGTDPLILLKMATTNGAKALGFDPKLMMFKAGPIAGALAVDVAGSTDDPLVAVMKSKGTPRWVAGPFSI